MYCILIFETSTTKNFVKINYNVFFSLCHLGLLLRVGNGKGVGRVRDGRARDIEVERVRSGRVRNDGVLGFGRVWSSAGFGFSRVWGDGYGLGAAAEIGPDFLESFPKGHL